MHLTAGMLRRNYRSHSALLSLPNRLFYAQGLLAAAVQSQVPTACATAAAAWCLVRCTLGSCGSASAAQLCVALPCGGCCRG